MTSISLPNAETLKSGVKKEEWKDKSKKYVTDTILKVTAAALLILLGLAILGGVCAFPVVLPAFAASALVIPVIMGAMGLSLGAIGGGAYFLADLTDYRKSKNVLNVFNELKITVKILPLSHFKKLNRYGIISDSELSKRVSLEGRVFS